MKVIEIPTKEDSSSSEEWDFKEIRSDLHDKEIKKIIVVVKKEQSQKET